MISALIDTCVWLDLAQDSKQTSLLLVVENMVKSGDLKLIVPKVVIDEFRRNRARIAKASARSLSSHFQEVKAAITAKFGSGWPNRVPCRFDWQRSSFLLHPRV